jgi:hypothetical protein
VVVTLDRTKLFGGPACLLQSDPPLLSLSLRRSFFWMRVTQATRPRPLVLSPVGVRSLRLGVTPEPASRTPARSEVDAEGTLSLRWLVAGSDRAGREGCSRLRASSVSLVLPVFVGPSGLGSAFSGENLIDDIIGRT